MTHLGIDIGGTKVALRLETAGGPAVERGFAWTEPGHRSDLRADLHLLRREVDVLLDAGEAPEAVGLAVPATVDATGTVATWPGRPGWVGADLAGALRELFPASRIGFADDGDLAALAEAACAGLEDIVYLGVGTGVGGGITHKGWLCPGPARGSCEVGHMIVDRSGEPCDCGRLGCLQAVASGPATLRRAGRARGRDVDYATLRAAFAGGDGWAVGAVEETCAALAAAVVTIFELVRPSAAVVGGGFASGLPGFVPLVDRYVRELGRPGHAPPPVTAAALGGLSSLHGALVLARSLTEAGPALGSWTASATAAA